MATGWKDIIRKTLGWLSAPASEPPTEEGLGFAMRPGNLAHYTIPENSAAVALPLNRAEFVIPEDD